MTPEYRPERLKRQRQATPFSGYREVVRRYNPTFACRTEARAAEIARTDGLRPLTDGDWRLVALNARDDLERKNGCDPVIDYQAPPKRHQPIARSTAVSSTTPGAVTVSTGDPLKAIPPRVYVEVLLGEPVPDSGWMLCPLHDDRRTPNFHVQDSHWKCWAGCGAGSIIDLAAALWQIEPRGSGYHEIRRRLLAEFGVVKERS